MLHKDLLTKPEYETYKNIKEKLKETEGNYFISQKLAYLAETGVNPQQGFPMLYLCIVSSQEQWCSSGIYKSPTDKGQR